MLTLYHLQTHFDTIAVGDFGHIVAEGEIARHFSTLFNNLKAFLVTMFSKSSAADLLNVGKG